MKPGMLLFGRCAKNPSFRSGFDIRILRRCKRVPMQPVDPPPICQNTIFDYSFFFACINEYAVVVNYNNNTKKFQFNSYYPIPTAKSFNSFLYSFDDLGHLEQRENYCYRIKSSRPHIGPIVHFYADFQQKCYHPFRRRRSNLT